MLLVAVLELVREGGQEGRRTECPAIPALWLAQTDVSLLLLGPPKASLAVLWKEKVVKQHNRSFSLGRLVGSSPWLRSKGKGGGQPCTLLAFCLGGISSC